MSSSTFKYSLSLEPWYSGVFSRDKTIRPFYQNGFWLLEKATQPIRMQDSSHITTKYKRDGNHFCFVVWLNAYMYFLFTFVLFFSLARHFLTRWNLIIPSPRQNSTTDFNFMETWKIQIGLCMFERKISQTMKCSTFKSCYFLSSWNHCSVTQVCRCGRDRIGTVAARASSHSHTAKWTNQFPIVESYSQSRCSLKSLYFSSPTIW